MGLQFQKATKKRARLRAAIVGPAGSGKTITSLRIAPSLGKRIAVIDTERGSASKYADMFDFDALELDSFSPETYVSAIKLAEREGYDVIIIDSLSHAWSGTDGALEQVDNNIVRYKGNKFAAWRDITPKHNSLVDAILQSRCHVIVTMRAKTVYEIVEENGKKRPVKIGLAPVQRDGIEYELDVVGDIDLEHKMVITKSRCSAIADKVFREPGEDLGNALRDWLTDGAEPPTPAPPPATRQRNDAPQKRETAANTTADVISLLDSAADGAARLAIVNGAMQSGAPRDELADILEAALQRADGERSDIAKMIPSLGFDEATRLRLREAYKRGAA